MQEKVKLCSINEIEEGKSKGFSLGELACFIVKKNNRYYAYKNSCPHLGVEMEWQEDQFLEPDGELIQCNMHGALFTIENGECISGPCQGDALTSVAIEVSDQTIYLLK